MTKVRYLSLDILRGFAALTVLVSHLNGWTHGRAGSFSTAFLRNTETAFNWLVRGGSMGAHRGVVIFIVLSGFCIHLPQASKPARTNEEGFWRNFILRRILRIGPVYWFAVALGIGALLVTARWPAFTPPQEAGASLNPLAAVLKFSFLSAWVGSNSVDLGNVPLRTVAVEVWLYAAYPAVLFFKSLAGWRGAMACASAVYVVGVGLAFRGIAPVFVSESFLSFFLYWVMGAWAADAFVRDQGAHRMLGWVCTLAAFALNFAMCHVLHFRGAHVVTVPLSAAATACFLYSVMTAESRIMPRAGAARNLGGRVANWMASLGERSYSLYAVHTPLITLSCVAVAAMRGRGWTQSAERPLAAATIVIVTLVVYELIEKPSHRLAKRASRAGVRGPDRTPVAVMASPVGAAALALESRTAKTSLENENGR
ncbi:MAG TPA: acyltransferase [Tepidisphaeraceae bacterium]|jgi:peptidoglycan/LPS O-acetylase OafA/YrhL|nr:acyltransferase [Tepidisphaeraceae bacterium]